MENNLHSSDEDEPPPLPPPRHESLIKDLNFDRNPVEKALPKIPNSTSLIDFSYDNEEV